MRVKKVFISLATVGLVCVLGLAILGQFLPLFLETTILPSLALQNGIGWQQGQIRHIGLTGFEAGAVVVGRDRADGITVDAVHADYTPWGLFQKRVNAITISGLALHVSVDEHGTRIHGIDMDRPAPPSSNAFRRGAAGSSVAIPTIRITHAVLNLDWRNRRLRIPFSVRARLADTGEIDAMLAMYPCGQEVRVAGSWSQPESSGRVSLTAQAFSMEKMMAMLKVMPGLIVGGDIDLLASAAIRLSPFAFSDLSASVSSASFSAVHGDMGLAAAGITAPFYLKLDQTGPQHFALKGGGLMVRKQVPLVVDGLEGDFTYDQQAAKARAQVRWRLPVFAESAGLPIGLRRDLKLVTRMSAHYATSGNWRVDIDDAPGGTGLDASVGVAAGDVMAVSAGRPSYHVTVKGRGAAAEGTFSATAQGVRVVSPTGTVDVRKVVVQGDVAAGASEDTALSGGSAEIQISGIQAEIGRADSESAYSMAIPEIRARGEMQTKDGTNPDFGEPVFRGDLRLAASTLNVPASQVRLSGIEARIPWQWPVGSAGARGMMAVGSIEWQNREVGSLGATVRQQQRGIAFQGEHLSALLPALALGFSGHVAFPPTNGIEAQVVASLERPASAPEIDLGLFSRDWRGIFLRGALSGELEGAYMAGGLNGSACVRLEETDIRLPGRKVVVQNMNTGLCFPDLPLLTTGPSQTLTFEAATVGNFKLEGGRFHFQLEPYQTLFVEKGRIGWCGGQIRLQPMRITPGLDAYETRLDCDRLNLAQILAQLSVADARGEGTVNGTLPVSINAGRIRFDDGFLYSSPGDGGKISLSGADALMAGIPQGTRQFFQVDLAREALKDFEYKWAKLRLVSEAEELRMRLQFDGKPGRILPFEYDESLGGFIRVDANSRGSDFQGISLDVNFRVPLNELLEYKDVLNFLK